MLGEGGEQGDPLMPMLFALGQHQALRSVQSQLPQDECLLAFHDNIYVVSQPEQTVEIHDILTEDLWDYSCIQIHAGKTQIWNRGGHIPTNHDTLLRAAHVEDPEAQIWFGSLEAPPEERGIKVLGTPLGTAAFVRSRLLNTIGCFLAASRPFKICSLRGSSSSVPPLGPLTTSGFATQSSPLECHATIADLLIRSLDAPPESAFHLSGAVECRTLLAGVGFETSSWFVVASAPPRRPAVAKTDPTVRVHGWQFFASRAVEEQFIASTVTPCLTQAALFSQSGPMWAHFQCHPHR